MSSNYKEEENKECQLLEVVKLENPEIIPLSTNLDIPSDSIITYRCSREVIKETVEVEINSHINDEIEMGYLRKAEAQQPDCEKKKRLSAKELANEKLHKSESFVYDHAEELGGRKIAGQWEFPIYSRRDTYLKKLNSRKSKKEERS